MLPSSLPQGNRMIRPPQGGGSISGTTGMWSHSGSRKESSAASTKSKSCPARDTLEGPGRRQGRGRLSRVFGVGGVFFIASLGCSVHEHHEEQEHRNHQHEAGHDSYVTPNPQSDMFLPSRFGVDRASQVPGFPTSILLFKRRSLPTPRSL